MVTTAIILCGGKGLRLRPFTDEQPKAMVPVLKRPLIEWIILWLKKNGITDIILSVDHKKEILMNHIGDGKNLGVTVRFNNHRGSRETGDALRTNFRRMALPETFLVMNGDQITDLSITELVRHHERYNPVATIVACPVRIPYGVIEIDKYHTTKSFVEKPIMPNILMSAGIYICNRAIQNYLPKRGSIEKTTFRKLAEQKKLKTYIHRGLFTTVNDHKDLSESEHILKKYKKTLI